MSDESDEALIDAPLQTSVSTDVTDMQILAQLLQKMNITLHTTIHNPAGMTAVDQGLVLIKEEFGQEMYEFAKVWPDMFRENMVAEDGARAKGIMDAVASKIAESKQKSGAEKMLGDLSR